MQGPTIVVENRPGAGSVVGTDAVSRAAPDGNTVLLYSKESVINPHLHKVNYDPLTSFEPICRLVTSPTVYSVNSASPYRTLADLIEAARAKPGSLTLAASGPASPFQIPWNSLRPLFGLRSNSRLYAPSARSRVARTSETVSKPARGGLWRSSVSQERTFFSAEMTVEWLRPPKNRPISL